MLHAEGQERRTPPAAVVVPEAIASSAGLVVPTGARPRVRRAATRRSSGSRGAREAAADPAPSTKGTLTAHPEEEAPSRAAASRTDRYPDGLLPMTTGTGPPPRPGTSSVRAAPSDWATRRSCEPMCGRWAGALSGMLHRWRASGRTPVTTTMTAVVPSTMRSPAPWRTVDRSNGMKTPTQAMTRATPRWNRPASE